MKIGPLFKHFGSKWQSAKRYPSPLTGLPLIEPYAGGAGYSLNYVERSVQIWEEDKHLQDLWNWLITTATESMIREMPVSILEGTDIRSLSLSYGQSLLLKHWQRTNNCGDCWTVSPWGNKPGQWTPNTRARVAEEVSAIKHWKFTPVTWTEKASYFVDPPYLYNYRYRFAASSFDFVTLAERVRQVPTGSRVVVCEAACPKTGKLPDYLPFAASHRSVTSRRKESQNHHSKELVFEFNP